MCVHHVTEYAFSRVDNDGVIAWRVDRDEEIGQLAIEHPDEGKNVGRCKLDLALLE